MFERFTPELGLLHSFRLFFGRFCSLGKISKILYLEQNNKKTSNKLFRAKQLQASSQAFENGKLKIIQRQGNYLIPEWRWIG